MSFNSLENFFYPKSIAIIGASADLNSISGKPIRYLLAHEYPGKVYPINPKYEEIAGLKCYPSLLAVPGEVDMAIIAVNYRMVLKMLEDAVEKGVKYALIFSSGFAESGDEGKKLQEQVVALGKRTGIRIIGPNCQGMVNLKDKVAAGFSASLEPKPFVTGSIGFVTQSGALGFSIFNMAQEAGVGFSYVVSTGNEVDLHTLDFMEYMLEDADTKLVVGYLEGIKNGEQFKRIADRALALKKPLVTLKSGKTELGQKAASSHTASLTGSDEVYGAFVKQKGIIRVNDIEEIIDLAGLAEKSPLPKGKGLGVISTSGGAGIILVDTAIEMGLEIVELADATTAKISRNVPDYGSAVNPVDITAQVLNNPEGFSNVLDAMIADSKVDGIVVVITMITGTGGAKMANDLVGKCKISPKPISVAWTAGDKMNEDVYDILRTGKVPFFKSPVRSVRALGYLMNYGAFHQAHSQETAVYQAVPVAKDVVETAKAILAGADKSLTENQGKQVLAQFGIPITKEKVATGAADAVVIANEIGYPVAMKIDSPDILHKTEAGGLKLGIANDEETRQAYEQIWASCRNYNPGARLNGVLVQEMVRGGTEVIVGVNNDPQFGPTVLFGLGGIFVEILKDVSMRLAPVTHNEAMAMIKEIKGYGVLAGARGKEVRDIDAIADVLVRVSQMAVELRDEVSELDINPLLVMPKGGGVKVADALVIKK
ncbi:MAG: acetate--CoA ligase family protein [Clostridia bacterium]|nr:acetate--CoA ligase family protein [Clostridia bacterium]